MHPNFPSTDLFRFFFDGLIYTANIAKNPNSDYMIVNLLCLAKNKSKLELQGRILILFNLDRSSAVPLSLHLKKILSKILSIYLYFMSRIVYHDILDERRLHKICI